MIGESQMIFLEIGPYKTMDVLKFGIVSRNLYNLTY